MAILVVPDSAIIHILTKPVVGAPYVGGVGPFMNFRCSHPTRIRGECKITGAPGDNPSGWTVGLIQLKFTDTDWAYYRGQAKTDGSSFLQYSRPPSLPNGSCRDTLAPGGIFVDNNPAINVTVAPAGAAFPFPMSAEFSDAPSRSFYLSRQNGFTGKTNFLREAQTELHFCTVLSLRSPAGVFHHLKSVYWNVHWQGTFEPTNFANVHAAWSIHKAGGLGNMANVKFISNGAPMDLRFSKVITKAGVPNCNAATAASYNAPNIRESATWANFNVTQ